MYMYNVCTCIKVWDHRAILWTQTGQSMVLVVPLCGCVLNSLGATPREGDMGASWEWTGEEGRGEEE